MAEIQPRESRDHPSRGVSQVNKGGGGGYIIRGVSLFGILSPWVFPSHAELCICIFISVYGSLVLHISLHKTKDERGLIYELTEVFNKRAFLGINYQMSYLLGLNDNYLTIVL